jgi:lipoate-protein ligase B
MLESAPVTGRVISKVDGRPLSASVPNSTTSNANAGPTIDGSANAQAAALGDAGSPSREIEAPSREEIRARVLDAPALARLIPWGLRDYKDVLALQERLRDARRADAVPDCWLAGQHPTVITQGARGGAADLLDAADADAGARYPVYKIDRGGMTTIHVPGQLVLYPIVKTLPGLVAQGRLARALLATVRDWLLGLSGVRLEIPKGRPGLFWGERKVAAIGLSIRQRVSMHGIAINLCNDLAPWRAIVPCGEPGTRPATLTEAAGRPFAPEDLLAAMPDWLRRAWGYDAVQVVDAPF